MDSIEMRKNRKKLIEDARTIHNLAEKEKRPVNGEEREQCERMMADAEELRKSYEQTEELAQMRADAVVKQAAAAESAGEQRAEHQEAPPATREERAKDITEKYKRHFVNFLRRGVNIPADIAALYQVPKDIRGSEERAYSGDAMNITTGADGEYLCPDEINDQISVKAFDENVMRQISAEPAQTSQSGAKDFPTLVTDAVAAATAEEATFNASIVVLGNVSITPHKMTSYVPISNELLQDSVFDVEGLIEASFGRALGTLEENWFIQGAGTTAPYGIGAATLGADLGITAAGTVTITADELKKFHYSVREGYRKRGTYLMKDSTALIVDQLKDGEGRYFWRMSLAEGKPDTLLGRPVRYSEQVPAMTSGLKPIFFGDFGYFQIVDRVGRTLLRDPYSQARVGVVEFLTSQRVGAQLLQTEAIKHVLMS